jgi:hypothetical protein
MVRRCAAALAAGGAGGVGGGGVATEGGDGNGAHSQTRCAAQRSRMLSRLVTP